MTKITFIESLKQGLLKHHVHDIDDILTDYEDYFNEQLNLGKSEEDIAKRLGDVKSIIKDYTNSKEQQHKKWFDLVAVGFIAMPLLIMLYGVLIVFAATTLVMWAIGVYYLFQLDTFSFMPYIPMGVHVLYIILSWASAVLFFSLSVRLFSTTKSMTMQYLVKQSIRIGDYHIKPIYQKLLIYSSIVSVLMMIVGYVISSIVAKDFQYWHAWNWFR
ncbi:MAG TPA: DUF1700 domain-containing protein [Acholeplasmataceae bacterium]|nr:DUF1700 domain-containing protein [Acholeplasmataceae bacterium]HRX44777.1 DUF1700 domain-containing protein [Acholeplasmataceae bacterium]